MKKFVTVLAFASILGLTACSPKPAIKTSSKEKIAVSSETKKSTETTESLETTESKTSSAAATTDYFSLMIEAAQSQLPTLKEQMGETYTDVNISEGENHTIVCTYTMSMDLGYELDMEALRPVLAKGMKPILEQAQFVADDVKVQVIYLKPDQTEAGNIIITQEDVNNLESETVQQ
ncbi:hypothetical protein [Enterococcus sp. AZ109]|uniref:hypothetical protein n=1 Tax=Enterococcus sp. AZ109 TaxID=2774634 RepID=UPI003F205525